MTRNRLYFLVLVACSVGYFYLFYKLATADSETPSFCLIKNLTGYACPSCGTTRAVMLISQGKILDSLFVNPFGMLVAGIMLVCPVWITGDLILRQDSFYRAYQKAERQIRTPWVAIILIILVLSNWIWNLYKHL